MGSTGDGKPSCATVNKRQLAEIFGKSEETLTQWQKDGMPVLKRGRKGVDGQYEPHRCIEWLLTREVSKVQGELPRDRLARVQAERIEMDMATERGELVPAPEIEPAWAGHVIATRQELLRLPLELGPRARRAESDNAAIDLLTEGIEGALRKLSEDDDDELAELASSGAQALGAAA